VFNPSGIEGRDMGGLSVPRGTQSIAMGV